MTNELSVEDAIKILKSKMDGHTDTSYEWAETVRMAIKAIEALNKLESIIVEQLDKSTDRKECMTLRWVLDKMAEVEE